MLLNIFQNQYAEIEELGDAMARTEANVYILIFRKA
jgi:hypothetical protein